MIGILDLSMGNLRSVSNAVYGIGQDFLIVEKPEQVAECSHLIVPGVGSYRTAVEHLDERGLRAAVLRCANEKKPVLGICLGMQLLSTSGEEGGESRGLDLIPGRVMRLDGARTRTIPHVGWNNIHFKREHPVLRKVKNDVDFYFVHSYRFACADPADEVGETDCGQPFTSIVARGSVVGFQFHPEKSQENGLRLLENFCDWDGRC